jgi:hypothetical protein
MLIKPFKSVGELLFSDTRQQIREKLNEDFITGIRGEESDSIKEYYDYFEHSGLFVYYDENNTINAFEFFEGIATFNGINILNIYYNQLVKLFVGLDPDLNVEYNCFTSYKYGIGGATNDDPDSNDALPENVIIFRKSYYDFLQS